MADESKASGPLEGLIVLDLTRVLAGPFATMMFADLGATVIKVETPDGGDDARHIGPFVGDMSAYFASLNRGKKSIALNLKDPKDRALFIRIVEKVDILVENFRSGAMDKLELGYDALKPINPRLIYAAISGFGQTGPYRRRAAYDMVVQAMGGIMSITGHSQAEPVRIGSSIGDITAGLFGSSGVLASLYHRERTGEGLFVDVGMLDCQVAILENAIARYGAKGEIPQPLGARHPSITPFEAFNTKDEHIVIAAGNNALFAKLCDAIQTPALAQMPEFASNQLRTEHHALLKQKIEQALAKQNARHWITVLDQAGVPCGMINNIEQVVNDPHLIARNMIISSSTATNENLKMAGNPIKMPRFADPKERPGAPEINANYAEILALLGLEDTED